MLKADIARCNGVKYQEDLVIYWREGCENCLRRTAPRPDIAVMISPPDIVVFCCEYLIEPKTQKPQKA